MRLLFYIFFFTFLQGWCHAQTPDSTGTSPQNSDSLDFTLITTTDFMIGSGTSFAVFWAKDPGKKVKCPRNVNGSGNGGGGVIGVLQSTLQAIGNGIRNTFRWIFGGGRDCDEDDEENGGGSGDGDGGGGGGTDDEDWSPPVPGGYDDDWGNTPTPMPEEGGGGVCYNCPVLPPNGLPAGWGNDDNPDNETGVLVGTLINEPEQPELQLDTSKFISAKDTLQPLRVPCPDTLATTIRGDTLNMIWDSIKNSPQMNKMYDSLHIRRYEVGFHASLNNIGQYVPGSVRYGTQRNVELGTTLWTILWVHFHPEKDSANHTNVSGPSPIDLFSLLKNWSDTSLRGRFKYSITISGDADTSTFAIAITDTAKARAFLINYPPDSSVDVGGTNDWLGDEEESSTFYGQFIQAYKEFKKAGYPEKDWENYANVYMAHQLNMGITIYKKVDGVFKALNFVEETNSEGEINYRITICN
ncbi:MAG TPA: hypothetical protein PKA85_01665 [Ferruginibacter sp.]|nr:hypothetical protein [Ferruginibacter sp.]